MSNRSEYPVHIFNTLSKKKEVFQPIHEGRVGMYVCGPTVYGEPHLGHARGAITFDVVFRYLKFLDYKVRYVRNITDVGHLEDDVADTGEDKVQKKARLEQLEPMEVVQHYTNMYHDAVDALNCLRPSIEPSASAHIMEQVTIIKEILENGYAYESDGSVYFDMEKYSSDYDYGKLSGKILEDLISGSRTDLAGQSEKKGDHDFALWKKAKPEHLMKWSSPWSIGFPGWHLECTAMSSKYLGLPFDLHGGGMDLQFPHHEGEIAQSVGACGCQPVNYWMHNNMVTLDGEKMAKRKGNFITLNEMFDGSHDLLLQSYSPMTVRFFMLQSHYSSMIDFSNEALQASEKGATRLLNSLEILSELIYSKGDIDKAIDDEVLKLCDNCFEYMSDDFNTAKTIGTLFELSAKINAFKNNQLPISSISESTFEKLAITFKTFITEVLGLKEEKKGDSSKLDDAMQVLINLRAQARTNKDFALSDSIRDQLLAAGIVLKDEKSGVTTYQMA